MHSGALCFEIPKTKRAFVFVLLHDGGEEKMVLHFFLMSIGVQSLIHHAYNSYEDVIPPRFRFRHKRLATLMVPSVKLFRVQ